MHKTAKSNATKQAHTQTTVAQNPDPARDPESHSVALIKELSSPRSTERERARDQFVGVGKAVVPELLAAWDSADDRGRLEICKALTEIADPAAIPTLIRALEDDHQDLRWVAAEGLLNIGTPSVEPLLLALIDRAWQYTILDGAVHVLRGLSRRSASELVVKPLIAAIRGPEPGVNVPPTAEMTLLLWRQQASEAAARNLAHLRAPETRSDKPWYDRKL